MNSKKKYGKSFGKKTRSILLKCKEKIIVMTIPAAWIQIRTGVTLNKVDTEAASNEPRPAEGRDALLEQIRSGVNLKKVDLDAASSGAASNNSDQGGIACLLQRALQERNNAVCQSSTDDSSYDDDDWDD